MERVICGDGSIVDEGWYGWKEDVTMNEPIYCRHSSEIDANVYTNEYDVLETIHDFNDLGWKCHAVPPIQKVY